jgi:hypothetical protein
VVCIARRPDGTRRVVAVGEVGESPIADHELDVRVLTDDGGSLVALPSRRPRGAFAAVASPAWIESLAPQ